MNEGGDGPEEESFAEFADNISGVPLDALLGDPAFSDQTAEKMIETFIVAKLSNLLGQVMQRQEIGTPEDRADYAELMIGTIIMGAREAGAHRHQLSAAIRRLVREKL